MPNGDEFYYMGICRTCGARCAGVKDYPNKRDRTANAVKDFILDGLIIVRVPTEQANLQRCRCGEQYDLFEEAERAQQRR